MTTLALKILSCSGELTFGILILMVFRLRSFHVLYFMCTGSVTMLLSKTLKNTIRQPRPTQPKIDTEEQRKSYGMPSSHSTFAGFIAAYTQYYVIIGGGGGELSDCYHWKSILLLLGVDFFALAMFWSRVKLGYHTTTQVLAGSILGSCCASLSYWLWKYHVYYFFLEKTLFWV